MVNVLIIGMIALSIISTLFTFFQDIVVQKRKQRKHLLLSTICMFLPILFLLFIIFEPVSTDTRLDMGVEMLNAGEYINAEKIFEELGNQEMMLETKYAYAKQLYADENFEAAVKIFIELGKYKDSEQYLQRAELLISSSNSNLADSDNLQTEQSKLYSLAYQYYENGQYIQALDSFKALNGYKDSSEMLKKCIISVREESAHTISAGIRLVFAIKNDGTIISGGDSNYFDFTQWKDVVSISNLGSIAIGLKKDGTVVSTGPYSIDISDWADIVSISAGERYVIGLKSDGTVVGAGHDLGDGQLQISGWSNIVAIATGWRHTVGLDSDGCIHITGYRSSNQLAEINKNKSEWSDIIAIAAGGGGSVGTGHTVGLRADGTVVAVGDNSYGQCNVSEWTDIVAIAAGDWHTVGLRSDGTVISTQPNSNLYSAACDVDNWSDIVEVDAGCGYTLGLYSDGTVIALGYNDYGQRADTIGWNDIKVMPK